MTRTHKILAAIVAVGLAVGACYFLALAPKREEIAKLDTDVAAKEAELAQAQQTLVGYEQARTTYKSNYTTLARLGKAVPVDDDVQSLMVQLESAAERSGVDFEKIELGTGLAGASGVTPHRSQPNHRFFCRDGNIERVVFHFECSQFLRDKSRQPLRSLPALFC